MKFLPIDYLLSNNHVNSIIVLKLDFSDEEVLAYYISFLKTLSFKLNKHTIHFFYNEVSIFVMLINLLCNRKSLNYWNCYNKHFHNNCTQWVEEVFWQQDLCNFELFHCRVLCHSFICKHISISKQFCQQVHVYIGIQ